MADHLFHFYISANMAMNLSEFGIANKEVRAIQAKLYESAMKQTITLDTLKTYKEHLDSDIKLIVSNHCFPKTVRFESNFSHERRLGLPVKNKINKYARFIKVGFCCCQHCKDTDEEKEVTGLRLIHTLMTSDKNLPLIAFLNESGCDMKIPTVLYKYSPLTLAVSDKQMGIVKYFVKHFDKPEFKSCFQKALRNATIPREPCIDIMKTLLSAMWINADFCFSADEDRLLMKVLKKYGQDGYKTLQVLLEGGADPDMPDSKGALPLFYCILVKSTKLVELLIKFGAIVNQYGRQINSVNAEASRIQITALLQAVVMNNFDICRSLLQNGANPNLGSKPGNTSPLHRAAAKGSVVLVKLLIRYGANVAHTNLIGNTIVHNAVTSGSLETLETLLYADAPHDVKNLEENTPLMMTALYGHDYDIGIMKALLDHELGCDVNNTNQHYDTPLHFAALSNRPAAVRQLVDYGAYPNARNLVSATPLWDAVYLGYSEVVRELLVTDVRMEIYSQGKDNMIHVAAPDYLYTQARSTLYVALDKRKRGIVLLLKAAGYDIRKETWIQSEPIPNQDLNAALMVDWIVASKSPATLESLCKNQLRKYLASEPGRDIYQKIERLEIPQHLKNCLLLKDLH